MTISSTAKKKGKRRNNSHEDSLPCLLGTLPLL